VTGALVRGLCDYDFTLVSGFAEGVDVASHLAAVRNGGKTAAVLGCGIDFDYPQSNMKYREEILRNGVLISEYLPKTNPSKISFPLRNRILSGLSLGTVVIEAGRKSGSLVTANLALGQGRDVFAVPPRDLFDVRYQGNAELLRDGAIPIYGIRDICMEYFENYSHKQPPPKASDSVDLDKMNIAEDEQKRGALVKPDRQTAEDAAAPPPDLSALSYEERRIADILQRSAKPLLSDEIASYCDMYITDVLVLLTNLEMDGIIKPCPGGAYTI
jgi:DNA processing protein